VEETQINPIKSASNEDRILLSGGSGMLGTAIGHALDLQGLRILQMVRREARSPHEITANPERGMVLADIERLEGLKAAVHLSGANVASHRWTAAYKREIASSRIDTTRALAQTLAELRNPPEVLVVASATGIYGDRGTEVLDEQSSPGKGFLADLCVAWEAAAQTAVDAGIRVVHTRFGVVLARQGGALAKMAPLFRLGLGGRLGSGSQWTSWISLRDVVAGVLFALDNPALSGVVNFTAPNPVTNAEFTRALARALHRPAFLPAPAFALRLALGQMADETLLASARVLPNRLIAAGFQFQDPAVDAALAAALSE
jgi:uncharacterized protein (TIGR01777 family)